LDHKLISFGIIPPIPEQKRIVALLDTVFADLEKTRTKTEQNLKNARKLFDNYLQQVFTKKGDGWVETTLGELCEKMEYGTSSKSQPDGDITVLRMGNIQGGELDWEKLKYTSNESDIDKLLLKEDDVLFNRTNSPELVGKSAIYRNERPAIFAGYLIRIHRKKDLLDANYLNYYLNSNLARTYGYSIMSHSTNQANINGTKLKSYPINIPNISEQLSLGNNLRELESEIKKIENIYKKKLLKIGELKKSILQKAFSGELTTTTK
jgi:type I restriction enzyme S subunit